MVVNYFNPIALNGTPIWCVPRPYPTFDCTDDDCRPGRRRLVVPVVPAQRNTYDVLDSLQLFIITGVSASSTQKTKLMPD